MKNSIFKLFLAILALASLCVGSAQAANSKKSLDLVRKLIRQQKQFNRADDGSSPSNIFTFKSGSKSLFSRQAGSDRLVDAFIEAGSLKDADTAVEDYDTTEDYKDAELQSQADLNDQGDQSQLPSQSAYQLPLMKRVLHLGSRVEITDMKNKSKRIHLPLSSDLPVRQQKTFTLPTAQQLRDQIKQKSEQLTQARDKAENGWFWQKTSARQDVDRLNQEIDQLRQQLPQKEAKYVLPGLAKFEQGLKQRVENSSSSKDTSRSLENEELQEEFFSFDDLALSTGGRVIEQDATMNNVVDVAPMMKSQMSNLLEQYKDAQQTFDRVIFGPQDVPAQSPKSVVQESLASKKVWHHPAYVTRVNKNGLSKIVPRGFRDKIYRETFNELDRNNVPKTERPVIRAQKYKAINQGAIEHVRKGASQFNPKVINAFKQKYVQTKQLKRVQKTQPKTLQPQASQSRALVPVKHSKKTYDAAPQLNEALKAFLKRTEISKSDNVVDVMQRQAYMPLIASQSSSLQGAQFANQQPAIKNLFGDNDILWAKIKDGKVVPMIVVEWQPAAQSTQSQPALTFDGDEQHALVPMQSEKQAGVITIHAQNKDGFIDTLTIDLSQVCPQDLAKIQKLMQALNIDFAQPTHMALFNDQQKDVAMLGHQASNKLISFDGQLDDAQMPEVTTSVLNDLVQILKGKNTVVVQFEMRDVSVKSFDTLRSVERNIQDRRIAGPSSQKTAQELVKKRSAARSKKKQVQVKKQAVQNRSKKVQSVSLPKKVVEPEATVGSSIKKYAQVAKRFKNRTIDNVNKKIDKACKLWHGSNYYNKQVKKQQTQAKARLQQTQKPAQVRSSLARKVARKPKVNDQQKQTKKTSAPKSKAPTKRTTQPQATSHEKNVQKQTKAAKKPRIQVKQTHATTTAVLQLPQQKAPTGVPGIYCDIPTTTHKTQQPQGPPTYIPGPSCTSGPQNKMSRPLTPLQLFLQQHGSAIVKAIQGSVGVDQIVVNQAKQHVRFFGGMLTAYNRQSQLVSDLGDQAHSSVLAGQQSIGQTVLKMIAQNMILISR